MIDEKRLIEEVEDMMSPFQFADEAREWALKDVIEVIENQPKIGEWIPVEERLPELAGYACLVTIQNKFGQRKIAKVFTHYGTGTFWLCNERDINLNAWEVIAWMPLPEQYKKVEE